MELRFKVTLFCSTTIWKEYVNLPEVRLWHSYTTYLRLFLIPPFWFNVHIYEVQTVGFVSRWYCQKTGGAVISVHQGRWCVQMLWGHFVPCHFVHCHIVPFFTTSFLFLPHRPFFHHIIPNLIEDDVTCIGRDEMVKRIKMSWFWPCA